MACRHRWCQKPLACPLSHVASLLLTSSPLQTVLDVLTPLEAAAAAGDAPVPAKVQAAVEARVRMKKVSCAYYGAARIG